jgi:hypothetical protein
LRVACICILSGILAILRVRLAKITLKSITLCFLMGLLCLPEILLAQNRPARQGLLDLTEWDFFERGPANLTGEWEFYMSELVAPSEFSSQTRPPKDYVDFPTTWNEHSKAPRPGDGYATYRLKAVVNAPRTLALELPHFYSNYSLWINSKLIASNGTVGTTEKNSVPQWLPQTVPFRVDTDTLDIVIQASNFHHAKGGVREPILLGDTQELIFKREVAVISNLVLFGCLILIALSLIFIFLFSKKETSLLYGAALCLTWGLRSVFSNRYIANSYFPDFPWELCVKIEYITLYLMMIWAILFLSSIFKNEVNVAFKYLFCVFNSIFIGLTLFFNASLYTQFLPVYLSFCVVLLVYIIYILIRALVYEREGVWFMIGCLFLGVILFSYDIFSYQVLATLNPIIINLGYLTMFILMATCLLYQLGFMKKSAHAGNMLTYEDLYGTREVKR